TSKRSFCISTSPLMGYRFMGPYGPLWACTAHAWRLPRIPRRRPRRRRRLARTSLAGLVPQALDLLAQLGLAQIPLGAGTVIRLIGGHGTAAKANADQGANQQGQQHGDGEEFHGYSPVDGCWKSPAGTSALEPFMNSISAIINQDAAITYWPHVPPATSTFIASAQSNILRSIAFTGYSCPNGARSVALGL